VLALGRLDPDVPELTLLGRVPGLLEVLLLLSEVDLGTRNDAAVLVVHEVLLGQASGGPILGAVHYLGA